MFWKRSGNIKENPDQPIIIAEDGCIRFKKNKIVDKLLDVASEHGMSLNDICMNFDVHGEDNSDYTQLMQLIGYSVSGYGDLSTSPKEKVAWADSVADKIIEEEDKKNG